VRPRDAEDDGARIDVAMRDAGRSIVTVIVCNVPRVPPRRSDGA
jgi:hypothetical protein